jgi:hypothetical protein
MSRVKMPHNNRMSGSTALKTNDMWSKTIGYNPYAALDEDSVKKEDSNQTASLLLLAKMSNLSGVESRGGCKRCNMLGHLTFQCRNPIAAAVATNESTSDDSDSDSDSGENAAQRKELMRAREVARKEKKADDKRLQRKREREQSSSSSSSAEDDDDLSQASNGDQKKRKHSKKDKDQKHKKDKKSKKHKKDRKHRRH